MHGSRKGRILDITGGVATLHRFRLPNVTGAMVLSVRECVRLLSTRCNADRGAHAAAVGARAGDEAPSKQHLQAPAEKRG